MSDVDFGDIEPDDVFAAEGDPDPEQVARRLHDLRRYLDSLIGRDPGAFDALDPEARSLALAIGEVVVDWLVETDPDTPELAARRLHEVRRYWSRNALPVWEEVPDDERAVAVDLLAHVIAWLRREGSLR